LERFFGFFPSGSTGNALERCRDRSQSAGRAHDSKLI